MDSTCSGCGRAVSGGDVMYTPDARVVCPACFAKADLVATQSRAGMGIVGVGAIVGLVPFAVKMYTITNGTYRDWVAVGCGAVAIAIGAYSVAKGPARLRVPSIGVALLGVYQILVGLGVFYKAEAPREEPVVAIAPAPVATPDDPAACEGQEACFQLGLKLAHAKQFAPAIVAYQRACDAGSAGACHNIGVIVEHGQNGPKDDKAAAAQYQRACDVGGMDDCALLAEWKLGGKHIPADIPGARPLLEKACEAKVAGACNNLGVIHRDGMDVPADPVKAIALFEKSCSLDGADSDFAEGCNNAGSLYAQGIGTKADGKHARELFEKGCAHAADLCFNLGVANERGLGGKKDLVRARELYSKACDAEAASACFNLSIMLADGEGGAKDADRGKALRKRACELGQNLACDDAAKKSK